MIKKWMVPVLGLASCAVVGVASAAEPTQAAKPTLLTSAQMDNVTAGHAFLNISGNNLQIATITQVAVVVGNDNIVDQTALAINYFSYPAP